MKLQQTFVDSGLELAKGARLFGIAFEDMTRDELIAAAAKGWKAYTDHLESSIRSSELTRMLNDARHRA